MFNSLADWGGPSVGPSVGAGACISPGAGRSIGARAPSTNDVHHFCPLICGHAKLAESRGVGRGRGRAGGQARQQASSKLNLFIRSFPFSFKRSLLRRDAFLLYSPLGSAKARECIDLTDPALLFCIVLIHRLVIGSLIRLARGPSLKRGKVPSILCSG